MNEKIDFRPSFPPIDRERYISEKVLEEILKNIEVKGKVAVSYSLVTYTLSVQFFFDEKDFFFLFKQEFSEGSQFMYHMVAKEIISRAKKSLLDHFFIEKSSD